MDEYKTVQHLVDYCQGKNVKRIKLMGVEVEFFDQQPAPMSLDPKDLAKTLTDSMPPDSAMLFASSEDMADETLNHSDGKTNL
jgi:hypothetical protein